MSQHKKSSKESSLRKSAEDKLRKKPKKSHLPQTEDIPKIVHELEVHQAELEIQNEELRRSQGELTDSRDSFEELYDFAPVGYLTLDNEGRILKANLTAASMIGIERSKLTRHSKFSSLVSPKNQDIWHKYRLEIIECKGKKVSCELDIVKADKSILCVSLETICMPYKDKNRLLLMMAMTDITERKRAEKALQEKEEKYRTLFNSMTEGFALHEIIYDKSGKPCDYCFLDMNPAFERQTGLKREEVIGKTELQLFPEDDSQRIEIYGEVALTGRPVHFETLSKKLNKYFEVYAHCPGPNQFAALFIDITERKRAEEALEASRIEAINEKNRLEAVLDILPAGVAILDGRGGNVRTNRMFEEIWRGPRPFPMNVGDYDFYKAWWPDTGEPVRPEEWASALAVQKGETVIGQEIEIERFDGTHAFVINSSNPIRNAMGGIIGSVVAILDITERKLAEEAQRESEERYRHLVLHAPAGIYEIDFTSGRFTEVNDSMCQILGYTRDELLAMTSFNILDDEGRARFATRIRKAQKGEQPEGDVEYRVRTRDGRLIWGLLNTRFKWRDGKIVSAMVVAHDITERKQAEEKLQESEERYRTLFQGLPVSTVSFQKTGQDFILKDYNQEADVFSGRRMQEFVGRSACDIYSSRSEVLSLITSAWETKTTQTHSFNYRTLGTDKDIYVDLTAAFVYPDKIILHTKDITAQKKAEEELQEAYENLQIQSEELQAVNEELQSQSKELQSQSEELQAVNQELHIQSEKLKVNSEELLSANEVLDKTNKELEQFAYIASHDLQEPLRSVASFAQLLEKRYKHQFDEDALEYFTFIVDGAKRMQDLVQDLLQFSRVGRTDMEKKLTDCNDVVDKATQILKTGIDETRAEITHGDLPVLNANETRMIQLFQNLIGNAIKFRKKEEIPRVHISAERDGGYWLFSVKDNGMGIDPKYFEKIFVIFQRLNIRDEYSGTGIGLAICKKIVESNGGKIWVESKEGEGATFYFTFQYERHLRQK